MSHPSVPLRLLAEAEERTKTEDAPTVCVVLLVCEFSCFFLFFSQSLYYFFCFFTPSSPLPSPLSSLFLSCPPSLPSLAAPSLVSAYSCLPFICVRMCVVYLFPFPPLYPLPSLIIFSLAAYFFILYIFYDTGSQRDGRSKLATDGSRGGNGGAADGECFCLCVTMCVFYLSFSDSL